MSPTIPNGATVLALRQPEIDTLVRELRQRYVGAGVQLAVDLGRLIIERLFGGDAARWHARGRKDVSFRKLEKHPELPFHASTLSRAVAIYMLSKRRADLTAFQHVSPSHLHEIAGLGEGEQDRLLERVEAERWTMRRLRQEVAGMRGGRRRIVKSRSLVPWLRRMRAEVAGRGLEMDFDTIAQLELEPLRELHEITRTVLQEMETLARELGARVQELDRGRRVSDVAPAALRCNNR